MIRQWLTFLDNPVHGWDESEIILGCTLYGQCVVLLSLLCFPSWCVWKIHQSRIATDDLRIIFRIFRA